MKKTRRSNTVLTIWIVCFAIVMGVVALLAYNALSQKETYISTTREKIEAGVIGCEASNLREAFFALDNLDGVANHKIKIIIQGEKPSEMSYEYSGDFANEMQASDAIAKMQAKYNIALGDEADKLSPVFSHTENKAMINIYVEAGKLNSANAPVLFLTTDEMLDFYGFSKEVIMEIYRNKGFVCDYTAVH